MLPHCTVQQLRLHLVHKSNIQICMRLYMCILDSEYLQVKLFTYLLLTGVFKSSPTMDKLLVIVSILAYIY